MKGNQMGRLTGCFLETGSEKVPKASGGRGMISGAWVGPSIPVTSADPSVLVVFGSVWFDPRCD